MTATRLGDIQNDIVIDGKIKYDDELTHLRTVTRTLSTTALLAEADIGKTLYVDTDAFVITLPATVVGYTYRIINNGKADGAVLITISPNASDKIMGIGLTALDDRDLLNTKLTAKIGDMVELVGDGNLGWYVTKCNGTWAREA